MGTGPTESTPQLAALRDRVERMLDSEKLLPADGRALLEMLQQAEERISAGAAEEAGGLLMGFETLVTALAEAGVLDLAASHHCVVHIREVTASLNV